ncbi:hypothetical protein D6810_01565 [Candidatus Dojkabacteria bacterium]|uniref:Baseplate protein J-like domain-containing protein n=1 Tax=Candidatus Dojkabacteria bacterium TaxID=2099670 RepID=A0A3M0Z509_9BACT|nr:MAG: hypothetical protein D6810_01565 [Candidatus Dojkabacteria bacterium]
MIAQAEKRFFSINDTIFKVISAIESSSNNYMILVFPVDSEIFVGTTNFFLIKKISKSKKKVIICVTEDEYGLKLIQRVGLVVVRKVSQITLDLWTVAEKRTFSEIRKQESFLDEYKNQNVDLINEEKDKVRLYELQEISSTNLPVSESPKKQEQENKESTGHFISTDLDNIGHNTISDIKKIDLKSNSVFYVGQDVKMLFAKNGIISDLESTFEQKRKQMTGSDLSKVLSKRRKSNWFSRFFSFFKNKKDVVDSQGSFQNFLRASTSNGEDLSISKKRKFFRYGLLVTLFLSLLLASAYFVINQVTVVDLFLSFKKQAVYDKYTLKLTLDKESPQLGQDGLVNSGYSFVEVESVSLSKTANVSKKSLEGTKAKGVITIYNLTDKEMNLAAGTKVVSSRDKKVYVLIKDVKVPAVSANELGERLPQFIDDVPIEALNIGSEGNLIVSEGDDNFLIDLPEWKDLTKSAGRVFRDITGGMSKEVYKVLEEDFENVKKELGKEAKELAKRKVKALIAKDEISFDEYLEYFNENYEVSPKIGEVSEDGSFNVSASISARLPKISIKSLHDSSLSYINSLLGDDKKYSPSSGLRPSVESILKNGDNFLVEVSLIGDLVLKIDENAIFESIKGLPYQNATEIIGRIENVDSYRLNFKPALLPNTLYFIPTDRSRVLIRVED